jgi:glyoxylase-like metal-dependent hydrolase (beta-lactamase superfamily II)
MSGLPIAAEWYAVTAVSETVNLIVEPHVDPLLQANIWHIRGDDADLLFDAGMGIVPLRPLIVSSFGREPILVLSHRHLDHAGAAHEFADVRAHVAEPVEDPVAGSLFGPELLEQLGLPLPDGEQIADLLIDALPHEGFLPTAYRLRPARVSRHLVEGDVLDLGRSQLEVIELPGHTPGSIGLLDRGSRALYSGDAIYEEGLIDDLPESDVDAYIATMTRLADLDVDIVHPGHGPSLDATALRRIATDYLRAKS